MSVGTWWLGRMCLVATGCFLAAVLVRSFAAKDAAGRRAIRRHRRSLDRKLRVLRTRARGSHLICGQALLALSCCAFVVSTGEWRLALALPALAVVPDWAIDRLLTRRAARAGEQLEPWLNAVANALKGSASLGEAIASTTLLIGPPLSDEIDLVVKEYELGTPLDQALEHLAERMGSPTISAIVLSLKVARKTGGNLPDMLENAAAALRERARLEGVVRTKTADGKAQAFVIGIMPLPMIAGIQVLEPGFFEPLTQTAFGQLLLAVAGGLWALAVQTARKIVAVEV